MAYAAAYCTSTEVLHIRVEDKTIGWQQEREPGSVMVQSLVHTNRGVYKVGIEPLFLEVASAERYHALKRRAAATVS